MTGKKCLTRYTGCNEDSSVSKGQSKGRFLASTLQLKKISAHSDCDGDWLCRVYVWGQGEGFSHVFGVTVQTKRNLNQETLLSLYLLHARYICE